MKTPGKMANFNIRHAIIDFLAVVGVYAAAYYLTPARLNQGAGAFYITMFFSFWVIFFLFMVFFRMYTMATYLHTKRVIRNTIFSLIFSSATLFITLFTVYNTTFSRIFLLVFLSGAFIVLCTEKMILLKIRKIKHSNSKVIYVGSVGENSELYDNFLQYAQLSGFNFTVLGYINTNETDYRGEGYLGDLKDFETILRHNPCGNVIFGISIMEKLDLEPFLRITYEMGIISRVVLDAYKFENYRWYISSLGAYPMLTYDDISLDPFSRTLKRSMDIVGGILGVILTFPIMIVTAILIKKDSPGPVLFKQVRVGEHGQKFNILKFRSMYVDAEKRKQELMVQNEMSDSRLFKVKDDPRITKIGKKIRRTSIDELPQFFNVIRGDMSLVGTRPPTVSEVEQYDRRHLKRISTKPGITGMWQTSGRNEIKDFEQVVQMDVAYIENWSLLLDIKLILKTVMVLLSKKGAY